MWNHFKALLLEHLCILAGVDVQQDGRGGSTAPVYLYCILPALYCTTAMAPQVRGLVRWRCSLGRRTGGPGAVVPYHTILYHTIPKVSSSLLTSTVQDT